MSLQNIKAFEDKKQREAAGSVFKVKYRPPTKIKDYAPGALVEKDMKFVLKIGVKDVSKEDFWYQHRVIDSFTRIRATELAENPDSQEATKSYNEMKQRFPFEIACMNADNGSENEKEFSEKLQKENPERAYQIVEKWQNYLGRQRIRKAQSRRIKRKEQIEALMSFIDAKLNKNKGLNEAKLQLINCELCSVA